MNENEIEERVEKNLCVVCGNELGDRAKLVCDTCYEKKDKTPSSWGDILWLCVLLQLFNSNPNEVAKQNLQKKLDKYGAQLTPFMTTEKIVDERGNIHYIDYSPIDWKKILDNEKKVK